MIAAVLAHTVGSSSAMAASIAAITLFKRSKCTFFSSNPFNSFGLFNTIHHEARRNFCAVPTG